jgi:aspartyl protease family protein
MSLRPLGPFGPHASVGPTTKLVPRKEVTFRPPGASDLGPRVGKGMLIAAWILALVLLVALFHRILGEQTNPNQNVDLRLDAAGRAQVVLKRNRAGHYVASGRVNGERVTFLVDTGATDVALPLAVARQLDLPLGAPGISRTANGDVRTWSTMLDSVDLGGLEARGVRASVVPGMAGGEVLLGMSYLKRFELIQRDGTLTVRVPR